MPSWIIYTKNVVSISLICSAKMCSFARIARSFMFSYIFWSMPKWLNKQTTLLIIKTPLLLWLWVVRIFNKVYPYMVCTTRNFRRVWLFNVLWTLLGQSITKDYLFTVIKTHPLKEHIPFKICMQILTRTKSSYTRHNIMTLWLGNES